MKLIAVVLIIFVGACGSSSDNDPGKSTAISKREGREWSLTSEAPAENVLKQLIDSVAANDQTYDPGDMARMGVLSGFYVLMEEPGIDKPKAVTAIIEDCYVAAARSQRIKNILGCYSLDRKVTDQVDRTLQTNTWQQTQNRFDTLFDELEIDSAVKIKMYGEFEAEWRLANEWLSSLTMEEVVECMTDLYGKRCR